MEIKYTRNKILKNGNTSVINVIYNNLFDCYLVVADGDTLGTHNNLDDAIEEANNM